MSVLIRCIRFDHLTGFFVREIEFPQGGVAGEGTSVDRLADAERPVSSGVRFDKWFVASTQPQKETLAQGQLQNQGFGAFVPRFRKQRRHARRVVDVLAPVFPGYIFVQAEPEQYPWRTINATRGVRHLIGAGSGTPKAVAPGVMAAIFARCSSGLIDTLMPVLKSGMEVKFISTAFADRIATIEQLDERGRIHVLLEILGQPVSMQVDASALEPVVR